jgi:TDG/mug DNA glycosylase family protein
MALPDLLAEGLKLVVCSSEDEKSAEAGGYYAGSGDRFWGVLHQYGLTPRELAPGEWQSLLEFGIGLTELADRDPSGQERGVRFEGGKELRRKIRQYNPGMLVFNGKQVAKDYLQMPTVVYGLLPHSIGTTKLFVCPSTKAGAKANWDQRWWDVMTKLA